MEKKLQHAHGRVGRVPNGGDDHRRSHCSLLSRNKSIFTSIMGCKMKIIFAAQLVFFFIAGTQIAEHQIQCARTEAVSMMLLSLPLSSLSNVRI